MGALLFLFAVLWCEILYKGAIYTLPVTVGYSVGVFASDTGAGRVGAFVVGGIAALATFAAFQFAFATARSQVVRWLIASVFVAPSLVMTYNIALDLFAGSVPSPVWREVICGSIAGVAGMIAFVRLAAVRAEGI